jgi:hypothetical protein
MPKKNWKKVMRAMRAMSFIMSVVFQMWELLELDKGTKGAGTSRRCGYFAGVVLFALAL